MSPADSLHWMAAGLVPILIGLVLFIFDFRALVLGIVGLICFSFGYFRWSPVRALERR